MQIYLFFYYIFSCSVQICKYHIEKPFAYKLTSHTKIFFCWKQYYCAPKDKKNRSYLNTFQPVHWFPQSKERINKPFKV